MLVVRRVGLSALAVCLCWAVAPGAGEAGAQSEPLFRAEMARHRPASRQPHGGGRGASAPAVHVLHGAGQRRRLEDDRCRAHVEADLRRPADRLDRRHRGRAVRSRTSSTSAAAKACTSGSLDRRRRLQVDRRRQRPGRISVSRDAQQIPEPRRRSAQSRSRVRRRARPSLRPERGARHLPLDRRRPDVPEGPLQGREHRRQRRRHRSVEPRDRLRDDVGGAAGAVGERGVGRHRRRHLQVDRRRHDLEAADQGPAGRSSRPTWRSRRRIPNASMRRSPAPTSPALLDQARGTGGIYRSDDAGESWTLDDARIRGRPAASAAAICRCRFRIRRIPTRSIIASTVSWKSTDGGKTWLPFKGAPGGEDYQNGWINPDNPDIMLLAADQGAVVTLNGGADLELLVQPVDRADVPRRRRQRVPVPRVQRPAGERIGLRVEPRQLRRDLGPRLAAGRRRRVRLRRAGPARSRTSSTAAAT